MAEAPFTGQGFLEQIYELCQYRSFTSLLHHLPQTMSQTISATRSPTLRIDLFPPSGSRFDTENDYGFDDNTGRYVLGPTP